MKLLSRLLIIAFGLLMCVPDDALEALALVPSPILFVTQVPVPDERNDNQVSNVAVSVVSPLGNHLGNTANCGRGGDLWIRYTNSALLNLTRKAGFGTNGAQHAKGIAVRDPLIVRL